MHKIGTGNGSAKEGEKEFFLSMLFRTCIKLQTTFDGYFVRYGMTAQEAAVLVRCSEAVETSPGRLALSLGRDKGKVSRFLQRLEARGLITRKVSWRDHRSVVLKATSRARRIAPGLILTFENIRSQLFAEISVSDVERMGLVLSTVLRNAEKMSSDTKEARRIP